MAISYIDPEIEMVESSTQWIWPYTENGHKEGKPVYPELRKKIFRSWVNAGWVKEVFYTLSAHFVLRKNHETTFLCDRAIDCFSLTLTGSMGAESEPVIQTVTKIQTLTATKYIRANQTEPMEMGVTSYTSGYESTQKQKGEEGYGITFTGTQAGVGTCAVDPRYITAVHPFTCKDMATARLQILAAR